AKEDASLLVVGNRDTPMFPEELIPYTERTSSNKDKIKVNFLINYGWQWDLKKLNNKKGNVKRNKISNYINSNNISRVDLIIRWGYRRRLSGFLPVQSIYADFYVVDEFWPDYKADHLYNALKWYDKQDLTYGG
ncbi:MAG: undecaprenyl diphosphate synthase family protein, partial [archaeon]